MLMSSLQKQLEIKAEQVLPGSEGGRGEKGVCVWGITQTMYAHVNK
jgi:hypothetical protein